MSDDESTISQLRAFLKEPWVTERHGYRWIDILDKELAHWDAHTLALRARIRFLEQEQDSLNESLDNLLLHLETLRGALRTVMDVGDRAAVSVAEAALTASEGVAAGLSRNPSDAEQLEAVRRERDACMEMAAAERPPDAVFNKVLAEENKQLEGQLEVAERALRFIHQWAEHPDRTEAIYQIRERLENFVR